ncbi:hypothetical protein [Mucilaginibacter flavidus]|uniref:hypothetical protein n=1 Tax=Mucilaginibacter flavidus TaxID=2949309 RepID=UPI00209374EF|nr:hypothetical protein [Mucilaginibacter flavidus]
MKEEKSKYKTGWRVLLIKAVCAVAIVFLIEIVLEALRSKDALATALAPFHNHYFSLSRNFLTIPGMASTFSDDQTATTRFVEYFILGYIAFAIISMLIWAIPVLKKYSSRINSVLFFLLVLSTFLVAFFFPGRMTVIDTKAREIRTTKNSWWFIPETTRIPFVNIANIGYKTTWYYNGHDKEYNNYIVITLTTKIGTKINLGEIQAGEQKGTLVHKPPVMIPPEQIVTAAKVVDALNEAAKK